MEGGLRGVMIVFSAFMIQFLAFGNYACIGIYTVHLLHVFDNDAVGVSLISAIHSALLLCSGPLASFMMTKISFRKLSIAGAALVCVGIFCTPLVVYLPTMYIFFGVFAGLGGCLIYLPSHVLSGLYYDKHRTLSTGVATAGTGMGATVMPLIVGMLIEEYTWRGSFMILAGLDLHLFIFALFMIPPAKRNRKPRPASLRHKDKGDQVHKELGTECLLTDSPDLKRANVPSCYTKLESKFQTNNRKKSELQIYDERNEHSCCGSTEELDPTICVTRENKGRRTENISTNLGNMILGSVPDDDISRVFIPSYLTWLPNFRNSFYIGGRTSIRETAILDSEDDSIHETCDGQHTCNRLNVERLSLVSESKNSYKQRTLKEDFKHHIRVLTNFKFIIYFISTIIWSMTSTLFVTFGPDLIVMKGHAAVDAAFVFTFYGVGQLLGCIFISVTGNFFGRRIILYMFANVLTGVFMSIVPVCYSFTELALLLVCMGFALGGVLGLYMIVSVDILGEKDMEIGLGYVLMASGIGCFVGPPLGGFLSQVYGGYDESVYMAGVFTIFAGLIMALIYIPTCKTSKDNKPTQIAK